MNTYKDCRLSWNMPFLWVVKKIATTLLQWPLYLNVPFYPYLTKGKTAREKSLTPEGEGFCIL
jgi:hypothetical protein